MRIPPGHVFPVDRRNGGEGLYLLEGELYTTAGEAKALLKAGDRIERLERYEHYTMRR